MIMFINVFDSSIIPFANVLSLHSWGSGIMIIAQQNQYLQAHNLFLVLLYIFSQNQNYKFKIYKKNNVC